MAAGLGHRLDDLPPQLVGQLLQVLHPQVLHVRRILDAVQDGLDAGAGVRWPAFRGHVQRRCRGSIDIIISIPDSVSE